MSGMTTNAIAPSLQNWVAAPLMSAEDLDLALRDMTEVFAHFWSVRLGRPEMIPVVTLVSGQMMVHFANGLTERERALSVTPEGSRAVVNELHRELDLLYPVMAEHVEQRLNCFVAESHLTVDAEESSIICVVTLRDLPRVAAY